MCTWIVADSQPLQPPAITGSGCMHSLVHGTIKLLMITVSSQSADIVIQPTGGVVINAVHVADKGRMMLPDSTIVMLSK